MPNGRPEVTIHFAQTLDGRIAFENARVSISSEAGIAAAHHARAANDAVLVGARTVMVDDPQLTVRACAGRQPLRVVLASACTLPDSAKLLAASEAPLLVIGAKGRATPDARASLEARGAQTLIVEASAEGVSLPHALAALHARGIARLLVEGGARVLTSFLRARLVDRASIEIAPHFFGASAVGAVGALLGESVRLEGMRVDRAGPNLFVRGDVVYGA